MKASERAAAVVLAEGVLRAESRSASTRVVIGLRGGEVGGPRTRLVPRLANWRSGLCQVGSRNPAQRWRDATADTYTAIVEGVSDRLRSAAK